jgi:hypothetical protein
MFLTSYTWWCGQRSFSRQETRDRTHIEFYTLLSLSTSFFAELLSSLPQPRDCMHSRSGEQASEIASVKILHRETGDMVFGEVRVLPHRFIYFLDRFG